MIPHYYSDQRTEIIIETFAEDFISWIRSNALFSPNVMFSTRDVKFPAFLDFTKKAQQAHTLIMLYWMLEYQNHDHPTLRKTFAKWYVINYD